MIKKPNLIIITLICAIVIVEILFLRPSNVETGEETTTNMYNSIERMVESEELNDEVGYTIDGFHYTAVEGEAKHWELTAKQAILYEKSQRVVAHQAEIRMFDPEERETFIKGDTATYTMGSKDLDLSGNVSVTFPDGFWLETSRAHYAAQSGAITSSEPFHGISTRESKSGEVMEVWGTGFSAYRLRPEVAIQRKAHVEVRRTDSDTVDVRADGVRIDRARKLARFSMMNSNRYVESRQGTLEVKSRRQEVGYDSGIHTVKNMTAYDDVVIVETRIGKNRVKYATSQKAEFLTRDNKIMLSGFPSVYQERDTVQGELIIIDRKNNLVEVTHANSFHDGRDGPASAAQ